MAKEQSFIDRVIEAFSIQLASIDEAFDICDCVQDASVAQNKDGTLKCFTCGKTYPNYINATGSDTGQNEQQK